MSMAPTLNSWAPAPLAMSTAATTKMAAVINTKISLTMVVIIVLLRTARWTVTHVEKQSDAITAGARRDCGCRRTRLRPPHRGREKNRTHNRPIGATPLRHAPNTRQPHRRRARDHAFAFPLPFRRERAVLLA